jgi:hypothetical protein
LTKIGVFISHKQEQSSIAAGTAERAIFASRARVPGKFTAYEFEVAT